jgi:fluoroacetyl-CoA thioesterase
MVFRVHAEDEEERIGEGVHERIIISLDRFDRRMQEKSRRSGGQGAAPR